MGGHFTRKNARILTRRQWLLAFQVGAILLVPTLFWAGIGLPPLFIVVALAAIAVMALGSFALWLRVLRERVGKIKANEDGLWLDDRLIVARGSVRTVVERKNEKGVTVWFEPRLSLGLDFVEVEVGDEANAQALIEAMELGASRSLMQYAVTRGTSRSLAIAAGALALGAAGMAAVIIAHLVPPLAILIPVLPLLVALSSTSVVITVGADGIRLAPALGAARFIPYGKIRAIHLTGADVKIETVSDEKIDVCFGHVRGLRWAGSDLLLDQAKTFVARVRERITVHENQDTSKLASSLARGGRRTADWIKDISEATDGAASFRVPAVPLEALLAVVEDERADAEARVAAAVAVRRTDAKASSRTRVRVAATACADLKLRVALENAADAEDDAELADALDLLDGETQTKTSAQKITKL